MRLILSLSVSLLAALGFLCLPAASLADTPQSISLPDPQKSGGMPLLETLEKRHSTRSFSPEALSLQDISNILWCAFGINRPNGGHTIPTALGRGELRVYAVLPNGVYLYQADKNALSLVLNADHTQDYGGAPLTLLYAGPAAEFQIGSLHAGSAYQGVGLYCASEGLANVVKITGIDNLKGQLAEPEGWQVLVVQSIGFPAQQ